MFGTNRFNQDTALLGNGSGKDGLASFRTPNQVIDDEMDPMLITLIVKIVGFVVVFNIHIYSIARMLHERKG